MFSAFSHRSARFRSGEHELKVAGTRAEGEEAHLLQFNLSSGRAVWFTGLATDLRPVATQRTPDSLYTCMCAIAGEVEGYVLLALGSSHDSQCMPGVSADALSAFGAAPLDYSVHLS